MVKYVTFWFFLINYVPEHTAVNQLLFSELYSWVDYSVVSLAPAMELCGETGKHLTLYRTVYLLFLSARQTGICGTNPSKITPQYFSLHSSKSSCERIVQAKTGILNRL